MMMIKSQFIRADQTNGEATNATDRIAKRISRNGIADVSVLP
jgi:hypothetical protein